MADDKGNRGGRDRATVSGAETYEVDYFAKKHGMSRAEAQALIDRVGNSRAALEAAVAKPGRAKPPGAAKRTATATPSAKPSRRAPARQKSVAEKAVDAAASVTAPVAAPVTAAVTAATDAVVAPIAESLAPVARQAAGLRRKAGTAARRGTSSVRTAALATPKAVARRATAAVDGAKSAATSRTAAIVGAAAAGLVTGLAVNLGRKVAVQAPSALAGDWFDAVKVEHKLALALFDQLQATGSDDTGKRDILLTQLKHALGKHAFTEENVLYPALRAWGDTADADKLHHDHGYVKQNLYDLEEMDNAAPAFLEKVAAFRAELEEHIREEEEAIFPPLHAALGEAGNARVTAQANKEGFKLA